MLIVLVHILKSAVYRARVSNTSIRSIQNRSVIALCTVLAVPAILIQGCQSVPSASPHQAGSSEIDRIAHQVNEQGKPELAASLYQQAADQSPTADNYIALGQARLAADQLQPAADAFRSALRHNPSDMQALLGLGETRRRLGQPGYAIRALAPAAQELDTTHAWTELGLAYIADGNAPAAVQAFQSAVTQTTVDDLDARTNLALAETLAGRGSDATILMRNVCRSPLAEARHFRDLLLVLVLSGQKEQARRLDIPGMTADRKIDLLREAQRIKALDGTAARANAIGLIAAN